MIGGGCMVSRQKSWRAWRGFLLGFLVLGLLFFLIRLIRLTIFPVFADEAIYLRWSQVMRAEPTLRFLPLSDGKQPLFMWLTIPFLKLLADPLLAGRVLSVLTGFGTLVGLMAVSLTLFKKPAIALTTGLVFTVVPYFFFFNRMALVDSLLTMFFVWIFFLGVWLARLIRPDLAMVTGLVLGAALLTKSPALFAAFLLPTTVLVADRWGRKPGQAAAKLPRKPLKEYLAKAAGLWLVVWVFAFGVYNLLRLGPNFDLIASRNRDYLFPYREVLSHPLNPLVPHLHDVSAWFPNLLTWPVLGLVLVGLAVALKKHRLVLVTLAGWIAAPLVFQLLFARVFTPRYLLPAVWPLVLFAGLGLDSLLAAVGSAAKTRSSPWRLVAGLLVALIILPALKYDLALIRDPQQAPLPRRMRSGYLEEWSSGYGIHEVRDYLRTVAADRHIVVGTEGYFGTLPDGLQIYFDKHPRVTIIGVGLDLAVVPDSLKEAAADNPTFLVANDSRINLQAGEPAELVLTIPKAETPAGETDSLLLYRIQ